MNCALRELHGETLIDIVYSQPADTGTGNNINTQLVYAVNYLKVPILYRERVLYALKLGCSLGNSKPYASAGSGYRHRDTIRYQFRTSGEVQSTRQNTT